MEEVAISCTRVPTGYVVLMPSLNVRVGSTLPFIQG